MKAFQMLFSICFLLPLFSLAQSNYKPGSVVTLKGDTIHGFIDYRGWDSNPVAISFKQTLTDRAHKQFTVNDIISFSIDDLEAYERYTCPVSKDITKTSNISSGLDTSFEIETVFLKILQKGKNVTLFAFTDDLKTRFYIANSPDYKPVELVYHIYQNTEGGTTYDNGFLKQLFALANKYNVFGDDLTRAFQKAGYSESDLLNIVSKINNISKAEYKRKYTNKTKFNFFSSLALNISTTTSNSSSGYSQDGGGPYTSYLPAVSFGINIVPNPNTDKIEFKAELLFSASQFNKTYMLLVSPYVEEKATFNQTGISVIPQIIYNFYNAEKLKIYLGLGFDFTSASYTNAFFGSQNPTVSDNGIGANDHYNFNSFNNGFVIKAGVKFRKKFEVFFNYLVATPTTGAGYFAFNNSSSQIGLAYFWGK